MSQRKAASRKEREREREIGKKENKRQNKPSPELLHTHMSKMAPYSLPSALFLTRAWGDYIWNRRPFGTRVTKTRNNITEAG